MKKPMMTMLMTALIGMGLGMVHPVLANRKENVQVQQQRVSALPLAQGLSKEVLPNGLTVYLWPRKDLQKSLEVRMVVRAGSLQEKEHERGLAHFVEHMAFNGTKNYPGQRIFKRLEKHGIQLGADINAVTSLGSTTYQLSIPQAKKDSLSVALETMREWAQNITFDPVAFDHERRIIVEEWRLRQGIGWRINAPLQTLRYLGSASARRDPIGLLEVVRQAPVTVAKDFYRRYYQPQNIALVIVGDFDREKILRQIQKEWGSWQPQGRLTPEDWGRFTQNVAPKDRTILLWDNEQSDRFIQVMYQRTLRQTRNTASRQWHDRLERLTFAILNKRFQKLQEAEKIARIQAPDASWYLSPSASQTLMIVTPKRNQSYERALAVFVEELNRLKQWGPTAQELTRVKAERLARLQQQAQNQARFPNQVYANDIADAISYQLPMLDKMQEWQMVKTFHRSVTAAHVQAVAERLLHHSVRKVAAVGPKNKESARVTQDSLEKAYQRALRKKTRQFSVKVSYVDLPSMTYVTPKIVATQKWPTLHADAQSERLTLANGIHVTLLSDATMTGDTQINVRFAGGYQSVPENGQVLVSEALRLPMLSGVENLKAKDIRYYAKKHRVSLVSYAELTQHGLRGEAAWEKMPALMRLLVARLNYPHMNERTWKDTRRRAIRRMEHVPVERDFMDAIHLASLENGKAILVQKENLTAKTSFARVQALEAKLLGHLPSMRVVVTSQASLDRMKKVVLPALASLKNRSEKALQITPIVVQPKVGQVDQNYALSQAPKTMVQIHYFDRSVRWSALNAEKANLLQLMVNWVLREKLRTQESGVYVVSMNQLLNRDPKSYYLGRLNFTAAPERSQGLIIKAKATLERIRQKGFTVTNLRQSKKTLRQMTRRQEMDTYYGNELLVQFVGDEKGWQKHLLARRTIQNVGLDEMNALVRDWWQEKPVVYQLTPKKGK